LIKSRHLSLILAINLAFLLVVFRLFYWQIWQGPGLKEQAMRQTQKIEKITPLRGKIFFHNNSPWVLNQTGYQLSIYKPNLKQDLSEIFKIIENIKPDFIVENGQIIDNFTHNSQKQWQSFPTLFSQKESQLLTLSGLSFGQTYSRYYPEKNLGQDITGIVAQNQQGIQVGYGGLEAYYHKQLLGKTGYSKSAIDATGQTLLSQKIWQTSSINGRDIHTFINRKIQFLIQQKLSQAISDYMAESGSIILMEPSTGAILAMTSLEASPSAERNNAIADLFEPGSIFKPLVVAMALDSQSIDKNYHCPQCQTARTIGEYTINNWDFSYHPDTDIKDTLKNSDNISMSYIIDSLGQDNFLKYYHLLNLDQKIGVDLQGEARPLNKNYWSPLDLATASFGQGFAITQLQMLHAFNSLANDGWTQKPKIVDYLSEGNKIIKNKNNQKTKIFDSQTTDQIKEYLKYIVENSNLAKLKPNNLEVCGKSGTAQIAQFGQYQASATIASFIGFSPCQQAKFSLIVTLVRPKASPWGSTTAAPVWFDLAEKLSHLL